MPSHGGFPPNMGMPGGQVVSGMPGGMNGAMGGPHRPGQGFQPMFPPAMQMPHPMYAPVGSYQGFNGMIQPPNPADVPHSLPYAGASTLAAAAASYMQHPGHYQKLGQDEDYDPEVNQRFIDIAGDQVEGRDIQGPTQEKFRQMIASTLGGNLSKGASIKPPSRK